MHDLRVFQRLGDQIERAAHKIDHRCRHNADLDPTGGARVLFQRCRDRGRARRTIRKDASSPQRSRVGIVCIECVHAVVHGGDVYDIVHTLARYAHLRNIQRLARDISVHGFRRELPEVFVSDVCGSEHRFLRVRPCPGIVVVPGEDRHLPHAGRNQAQRKHEECGNAERSRHRNRRDFSERGLHNSSNLALRALLARLFRVPQNRKPREQARVRTASVWSCRLLGCDSNHTGPVGPLFIKGGGPSNGISINLKADREHRPPPPSPTG